MADAPTPRAPRDLLVLAADRTPATEERASHPWNPRSEIRGWTLSRRAGLQRTGVNWLCIPPGKESFAFHSHEVEEEWLFVLSGQGELEIGDERFAIGPGDFAGFPGGSHARLVRNTGSADLCYLSGGENRDVEVADFPRLGRRMVKVGGRATVYPAAAGEPFPLGS
jgi:uncharacterized cupin superfamily protein